MPLSLANYLEAPVGTNKDTRSGYRVERVYVGSQEYRLVDPESAADVVDVDDRQVDFGWDWRPVAPRKFEVIVDLALEPTKQAPEKANVRLIGLFEAAEGQPSIPFVDFVKLNASAILFPFAREVVSTMTGRGPFGAFHIHPLNLVALLMETPVESTTGWKYLHENPALAESFGLEFSADEALEDKDGDD
jgi:preprotein translocase subunit SecB